MEKRLTKRQMIFIDEYVKSGNATEAAKAAGYSEKTAAEMGCENLRKPHIKAEIDQRLSGLADKNAIEADEIINRLFKIASADPTKVVYIDDNGTYQIKPTSMWGEYERAAVKKISVNKSGIPIVEFYDRDKILSELADKLGLYDKYGGGSEDKTLTVAFRNEEDAEYAE